MIWVLKDQVLPAGKEFAVSSVEFRKTCGPLLLWLAASNSRNLQTPKSRASYLGTSAPVLYVCALCKWLLTGTTCYRPYAHAPFVDFVTDVSCSRSARPCWP